MYSNGRGNPNSSSYISSGISEADSRDDDRFVALLRCVDTRRVSEYRIYSGYKALVLPYCCVLDIAWRTTDGGCLRKHSHSHRKSRTISRLDRFSQDVDFHERFDTGRPQRGDQVLQALIQLWQYISDLRACRVRELEEKRINREMAHIRQKFKGKLSVHILVVLSLQCRRFTPACTHWFSILEGNLDGYQKKKYLAKVVFTYILGYKVDVGHMEAVNLISSNKYSEKQIVSTDEAWHDL